MGNRNSQSQGANKQQVFQKRSEKLNMTNEKTLNPTSKTTGGQEQTNKINLTSGNNSTEDKDVIVVDLNSGSKEVKENKTNSQEDRFFGWPVLKGFKDLEDEKARFQLQKSPLDKRGDLDVNKIIGGIADTSKKEDRQISKDNKLDDKRLQKIAGGRELINSQDNLNESSGRLSQVSNSNSTERTVHEGENQDSTASAHDGDKPKLSRRARARANRESEQSDERGVLQAVEGDEVNGLSSEVVQGTIPHSEPSVQNSVESSLQSAKTGSANSLEMTGNKLPSDVSKQSSAKGTVSNTPASEGKGSLVTVGRQIGAAEGKGLQSLSVKNNANNEQDANVIKNASKGFLLLFSEKTDEILSPLSFVAHNHVKMAMAIIQLLIPALLTYFLVTNVHFITSGINNAAVPMRLVLFVVFYIGCLCASIFVQVLASGIKGMFIKAFIDAASLGESKK